jgi:hypothetical protein
VEDAYQMALKDEEKMSRKQESEGPRQKPAQRQSSFPGKIPEAQGGMEETLDSY